MQHCKYRAALHAGLALEKKKVRQDGPGQKRGQRNKQATACGPRIQGWEGSCELLDYLKKMVAR